MRWITFHKSERQAWISGCWWYSLELHVRCHQLWMLRHIYDMWNPKGPWEVRLKGWYCENGCEEGWLAEERLVAEISTRRVLWGAGMGIEVDRVWYWLSEQAMFKGSTKYPCPHKQQYGWWFNPGFLVPCLIWPVSWHSPHISSA